MTRVPRKPKTISASFGPAFRYMRTRVVINKNKATSPIPMTTQVFGSNPNITPPSRAAVAARPRSFDVVARHPPDAVFVFHWGDGFDCRVLVLKRGRVLND